MTRSLAASGGVRPLPLPPMHTASIVSFALFATALPLAAQQVHRTAHPQDVLQGGGGNFAPFGVFSSGQGAEARTQFLVPKDELPGPGTLLTGIELTALIGGTVDYASLEISAAPTTATSLSNTFASNLVNPPTVVLPATPLQVTWSTTAWSAIDFAVPYVHDGTSALVIEVKKVVQAAPSFTFVTMRKNSVPSRGDRPQMVYSFGGPGSGTSNATSAFGNDEPVSFRLRWQMTPTLRNESAQGPSNNQYGLGGSVTFKIDGDPNELWVLAAGSGFLPTSTFVPGLLGTFRLAGPTLFASGLLDPNGVGTFALNIPNTPTLPGLYLAYQAATVAPATGVIWLTNGTDHFVNP